MCGEYLLFSSRTSPSTGSPPHVWGIQTATTPAQIQLQDHPHMCGEYDFVGVEPTTIQGSPPHVWGIH